MTVQRLGFYKCILFRLNTLHGMLVSCTSKNVIYGKTCAECGLVNKGETGDVQKTEQKQKQISTLLAEAFPLCFSALYCHSLGGFGCSRFVLVVLCVQEKTSADSRLRFLLNMRSRYLQDLGGNHMTKPVVEPVLSTRSSFKYWFAVQK